MGTDLWFYMKPEDIVQAVEDDFSNFWTMCRKLVRIRWHTFLEKFHIDYGSLKTPISSKDLLLHLAKTDEHIEDREFWAYIFAKYDILFVPDTATEKIEKLEREGYLEVGDLYYTIRSLIKKDIKNIIKRKVEGKLLG